MYAGFEREKNKSEYVSKLESIKEDTYIRLQEYSEEYRDKKALGKNTDWLEQAIESFRKRLIDLENKLYDLGY